MLCPEMVQTEARLLERYIGGLPKSTKGNVTTSKAADLHETMEVANKLMDQLLEETPEVTSDNKRKWNDHSRNNSHNKRQDVAKAYAAGSSERKGYARNLPQCNRCKLHHKGQCTVKCNNC